jgi:GMP synthase (glutamine-hydrolysing)
MHLKLIEPLQLVWRHPFPGPGLAIRVIGEVTEEQLRIVREADKILIDEIRTTGLYRKISQVYAASLGVKAVGVMGDKRVQGFVVALRAVVMTDFMTADIERSFRSKVSTKIANEVDGVTRVMWDDTSKPPGTIELE